LEKNTCRKKLKSETSLFDGFVLLLLLQGKFKLQVFNCAGEYVSVFHEKCFLLETKDVYDKKN
jgi:hypothetical protein